MLERYEQLPKGVRFALYYGLLPVWAPVMVVGAIVILVTIGPIFWAINLWRDFK